MFRTTKRQEMYTISPRNFTRSISGTSGYIWNAADVLSEWKLPDFLWILFEVKLSYCFWIWWEVIFHHYSQWWWTRVKFGGEGNATIFTHLNFCVKSPTPLTFRAIPQKTKQRRYLFFAVTNGSDSEGRELLFMGIQMPGLYGHWNLPHPPGMPLMNN